MLEFIVLGRIPGTQFQITFSDILLITVVLLTCLELFMHFGTKFGLKKSIPELAAIDNTIST